MNLEEFIVNCAQDCVDGYDEEPPDSLGHEWTAIEVGGLMRDWDDRQNAGHFAECNNCGMITSNPRIITERCPA